MKLRLHLTDDRGPGLAQAWTLGDGDIHVKPPFHRVLFARRRVAHEVRHNVDPNDEHHPWWHFCVAVGHGLRLHDGHAEARCLTAADELIATGVAEYP